MLETEYVPILLCISCAASQREVKSWSFWTLWFRVLMAPSPSYLLPSPSSTFKVLSLRGPNKTMLLSSSREASWTCSGYRACVSTVQQGPSPILETDGNPSSSQPPPACAPCLSPCSWSCGGRDVFRVVSCFLIHCNITRQHKSLCASVFLSSLKKFNVLKTAGTT